MMGFGALGFRVSGSRSVGAVGLIRRGMRVMRKSTQMFAAMISSGTAVPRQ